MGFSTLFLIIKAMFPFIKDHLFGDKGLRDLLAMNKPATVLSVCLLVMLALVVYSSHVANETVLDRDKSKNDNELLGKRVEYLEGRLATAQSDFNRSLDLSKRELDFLKDDYADLSESYNKLKQQCRPPDKAPGRVEPPPAKTPPPPVKAQPPRKPEQESESRVLEKLKNLHY